MDVAILPAVLAAGLGVINDPVLGLAEGFDERAMAEAPDVFGFSEGRRRAFAPRGWIQNVAVRVRKQAEAIIFRPARARYIG